MKMYTASGNPAASPEKPLVMWLGSNGVKLRCPALEISAATDTTTSTSISNAKKNPAILVDTFGTSGTRDANSNRDAGGGSVSPAPGESAPLSAGSQQETGLAAPLACRAGAAES
jgi:hypothetical protein